MDRIPRNIGVVLFGAVSSLLTVALLAFLQARSGESLYGLSAWTYVPVGAIGAGFVGAVGYLVGALALRIRPGVLLVAGVFAIAAGVHLYVRNLDTGMLMATNRASLANPKTFTRFAAASLMHTRMPDLSLGGSKSSDDSTDASSTAPAAEGPHIDTQGDERVEGMAGGVGGMLAKADMGTQLGGSSTGKLAQMDGSLQSIDKGVQSNGLTWLVATLQIAGFAMGGLVVIAYLRSLDYCNACMSFLNTKGRQTRYFNSSNGVHSSVDDFLAWMKSQKLQEGILAHYQVGSGKKHNFSEYSSTIEIRTCGGCITHRLEFSARRKTKGSWKDIKLLRHTATSLEPIDVTRV